MSISEETKLENETELAEEIHTEETETPEEAKPKRRIPVRTVLLIGGAFILGFVVLGVITIQVWEWSNSVAFCANACHDVHPEEVAAFRDSFHANVKCVECHMGRGGTIENIFRKASHIRHLPEVIFDAYGRPLESETMRPANESCELCHWPPAFHGDTVRKVTRFEQDTENTEKDTYLILKTGAGTREEGMGYGIHWHITNPVEYIALDEHKQDVRWVRTTLPDGRTLVYNDVTNPLSPEEIEAAEKKEMDCVDCHNRMGHPFTSPEDLVHKALADGELSSELPYIKTYMMDLLTEDYQSREEALQAVSRWAPNYKADFPDVAVQYSAEIDQAQQVAEELISILVFEEPGINWEDFPDHNRHKDFPGCFRCHDGKHLTDSGESIRLQCNVCHNVPQTVAGGGRPPQVPLSYIQEPASHLETNFMADHRFLANGDCASCHGEIEFGADDSSFCANSSCHGRAWETVELDAAFVHPVELVGKHAEVWCHDCHAGVEKPEYVCSNCHEPPEKHLAGECDTCHAPEGFAESASVLVESAPEPAHELRGLDDCLVCHDPEGQVKPAPSDHADYENEQCVLCHKRES